MALLFELKVDPERCSSTNSCYGCSNLSGEIENKGIKLSIAKSFPQWNKSPYNKYVTEF